MILILGGSNDDQADAVQRELHHMGNEVARFEPKRLLGFGEAEAADRQSELASVSRFDTRGLHSRHEVHTGDVDAVWMGRQGTSIAGLFFQNLRDFNDVPVLPASPAEIENATRAIRQVEAAQSVGFAVAGSSGTQQEFDTVNAVKTAVTVVGNRVFAATDDIPPVTRRRALAWWHHNHPDSAMSPYRLRGDDADRCRRLARTLGLEHTVIHLSGVRGERLDFVDLDPCGDFQQMEVSTGFPMTRTLVDVLVERAGAAATHRPPKK